MAAAFSIKRMSQDFRVSAGHPLPHSQDYGHAGAVKLGEHNQHRI